MGDLKKMHRTPVFKLFFAHCWKICSNPFSSFPYFKLPLSKMILGVLLTIVIWQSLYFAWFSLQKFPYSGTTCDMHFTIFNWRFYCENYGNTIQHFQHLLLRFHALICIGNMSCRHNQLTSTVTQFFFCAIHS